ncbi:lipase family protein [Aeromicrobium duanguangcaii]|uniref:lipase family protein n=1 Tax=Aeromicrobium duanguangcaii TaxID=2968086 RepID=UPI00201838AF|nr:lipase family protein [Aeromicrobium duanguangcaii]
MKVRPLSASAALLAGALAVSLGAVPGHAIEDGGLSSAVVGTAPPGSILEQAPAPGALTGLGIAPADATATRVLYASTGARGETTSVSGLVIVPNAPWRGPGERPVVGVSPGTQGLADRCAASRLIESGHLNDATWIRQFHAAGYAIAMTDYEGLGTPGDHPFADNVVLGHNALDVVRAARGLGVSATAPVFLQGFSEGGGATAGALELAPGYAPELRIAGGHATAPTGNLTAIGERSELDLYRPLLLLAVGLLDDGAEASGCAPEGLPRGLTDLEELGPAEPAREPVRVSRSRIDVPFAVTSAWADEIVPHDTVREAVEQWCSRGSRIVYSTSWAPSHVASGYEGGGQAVQFFDDVLRGRVADSTCAWLF